MGHELVIVFVAALDIELLEIEGVLSIVDIVGAIELCAADDRFFDRIPRAVSAAAFRCVF